MMSTEHLAFGTKSTRAAAPVSLPRDLYAHNDAKTEWWYYHGHFETEGQPFGFQVAFFRHRLDGERIGRLIPANWITPVAYVGQLSVTDVASRRFHCEQHRAKARQANVRYDQLDVQFSGWSLTESDGWHVCRAGSEGLRLDLRFRPIKPPVLHGSEGRINKLSGRDSFHFSFTRMEAQGNITIGNRRCEVSGMAWMDREFGMATPGPDLCGWDWMALHLNDSRELMIYVFRDRENVTTGNGVLVEANGRERYLDVADFSLEPIDRWTSPQTGSTYPSGWRLHLPALDGELEIQPLLKCQEIDTRGTLCTIFWEGMAAVYGRMGGSSIDGRGYVELTGYESPGRFDVFNFQTGNISLPGCLACEVRWYLGRHRKTFGEARTE